MADPDRDAVYLAEDRLARLARHEGPMVVAGRITRVEPDLEFTSLSAARLFCTLTCLERGLPPVQVRLRRGDAKSHYSAHDQQIALASWGGWRSVVVHELAHHAVQHTVDGPVASHGAAFRRAHLDLLRHLGLPAQARTLADFYAQAGLEDHD